MFESAADREDDSEKGLSSVRLTSFYEARQQHRRREM